MGYSARYHAASLAAVFLALAIGILIGAQFGDDLINDTRKDLEKSLTENVTQARAQVDDLRGDLMVANEFGNRVYPALANGQLEGVNVGLVAFGSLSEGTTSSVRTALDPTGAELTAVGVVREPPDLTALANSLSETRFSEIDSDMGQLQAFSRGVGRQLVLGGDLLEKVRSQLFSRASGTFGDLDALIVTRVRPDELEPFEDDATSILEENMVEGSAATDATVVGVERTDTDPSSIIFFSDRHISSVDDIDLPAGKLAFLYTMLGNEGNFGVKEVSNQLLPELLIPIPENPLPPIRQDTVADELDGGVREGSGSGSGRASGAGGPEGSGRSSGAGDAGPGGQGSSGEADGERGGG